MVVARAVHRDRDERASGAQRCLALFAREDIVIARDDLSPPGARLQIGLCARSLGGPPGLQRAARAREPSQRPYLVSEIRIFLPTFTTATARARSRRGRATGLRNVDSEKVAVLAREFPRSSRGHQARARAAGGESLGVVFRLHCKHL